MITPQTIQTILARIDIIDIVGGFVKLKKRGTNYLGLCPFHNEKSPSFTVSPAKEIYKCFGCGRSGNSISFLMEHEKYSYVEALRWLAVRYNVEVEETGVTPEARIQFQVSDSLYVINSFAQKFFTHALFETEQGTDIALSYLVQRGFKEEVIRKFQLGFSPEDRTAFARAAAENQFNGEYLLKSGLVAIRNEELVDNYRGRIIFPVHNNTGKILGFGARLIKNNDKAPKYINTPENEIYSKSKILYGTWFARQSIDKNNECLLVEGYTDVISLHQSGIENVVASGGTSLTQDQLRLIKKYSPNLTIIYDGDPAGIKAALRGLDMALEEGLNVKMVLLPDREDPDSYVNKIGPTAFKEFIALNKKDFILFRLDISLKDAGNDAAKKSTIVNEIAETIAKINRVEDFSKRQDYIRQCSELMHIDETGLTTLVNKYIRDRVAKQESRHQNTPEPLPVQEGSEAAQGLDDGTFEILFQHQLQERQVVKILLEHGSEKFDEETLVADVIFKELVDDDLFDDKLLYRIIELYKGWYEAGMAPSIKSFVYYEDAPVSSAAVAVTNFPFEESKRMRDEMILNSSGYSQKLFLNNYNDFIRITTKDEEALHSFAKAEEQDIQLRVVSSMNYLKLKKIKRLIEQNQKDLQLSHTPEELIVLVQTHQHLKDIEISLLKVAGTVILK
ncbi:MAG: DNA primase [Chitinophagaceae bacterium]